MNHLIELIEIGEITEISEGERIFLQIDNHQIVLLNINGELYAIGDVCSHDNGPVGEGDVEDNMIICPRHGARFDVSDGRAISLPAVEPIPTYPIKIIDGIIYLGISDN